MMVNDQVQVNNAKSEYVGRAGFITAIAGKEPDEVATVRLDETTTHDGGDVEFPLADLKKL